MPKLSSSLSRRQTWKSIPQRTTMEIIDINSISYEDLTAIKDGDDSSFTVMKTNAGILLRPALLRSAALEAEKRGEVLSGAEGAAYNLCKFLSIRSSYALVG